MAKLKLGKLDAACMQIDTAITIWFNEGDPVSIHTLACSAYQIVHDINQKTGWRDLLYDSVVIKDEYRKQCVDTIKRPYNFLKHANKDASDAIEFDPSTNEVFIMFTCLGLELLGMKPNIARAAFILHQMLSKPEMLTEKGRADLEKYPDSIKQQALAVPKPLFFQAYNAYHSKIEGIS